MDACHHVMTSRGSQLLTALLFNIWSICGRSIALFMTMTSVTAVPVGGDTKASMRTSTTTTTTPQVDGSIIVETEEVLADGSRTVKSITYPPGSIPPGKWCHHEFVKIVLKSRDAPSCLTTCMYPTKDTRTAVASLSSSFGRSSCSSYPSDSIPWTQTRQSWLPVLWPYGSNVCEGKAWNVCHYWDYRPCCVFLTTLLVASRHGKLQRQATHLY